MADASNQEHLLSHKACHAFWKNFHDPSIYRVIVFMESVEDWTLDEDESVQTALNRLCETLQNVGNLDLKNEDSFIKVCAQIKTGQILRLLQCLDSALPGAASKILMYAEEGQGKHPEIAKFFIQRNIVFERLRLLSRIFSKSRLDLVQQALEHSHDA